MKKNNNYIVSSIFFVAIEKPFKLSLTISARLNAVEVSWYNLRLPSDGYILLTNEDPQPPFKQFKQTDIEQSSPEIYTNEDNSTHKYYADNDKSIWTYGPTNKKALYFTKPSEANGWITTNVIFDNKLIENMSATTKCYGYWAIYVDSSLKPVISTCMSAYATWMSDYKDVIKRFKFRDLFILGSHDSGSYRINFNANKNDTLVTKYALTQVSITFTSITNSH